MCWLRAHSLFCLFSEYFKTHPTPFPQPDNSYFSTTCFLQPRCVSLSLLF